MSQHIRDSTSWPDEKWTEEFCLKEAQDFHDKYMWDENITFYKRAISDKPYCRDSFATWCAKHKECQEIASLFRKVKDEHETRLAEKGLDKSHSEGITKMILQNVHWWQDKKIIDQTTRDANPLKDRMDEIDKEAALKDKEEKQWLKEIK